HRPDRIQRIRRIRLQRSNDTSWRANVDGHLTAIDGIAHDPYPTCHNEIGTRYLLPCHHERITLRPRPRRDEGIQIEMFFGLEFTCKRSTRRGIQTDD